MRKERKIFVVESNRTDAPAYFQDFKEASKYFHEDLEGHRNNERDILEFVEKEKYDRLEKAAMKLREAIRLGIIDLTNHDDTLRSWDKQAILFMEDAKDAVREFDEAIKEDE